MRERDERKTNDSKRVRIHHNMAKNMNTSLHGKEYVITEIREK